MSDRITTNFIEGRGAQFNPDQPFSKLQKVQEHFEGLDEDIQRNPSTQYFFEFPKKIINRVESPDIPTEYSMNPYQGCEHGCVYCYARNTHPYWGWSAGLDFESKIIIKKEAAVLLEQELRKKSWNVGVIMLSGNTDCYQPVERKMKITRSMLEVLLRFRNPVGMITKNSLILRDLDLLRELAALKLVHVMISITTLDEKLRQKLEPRTVTAAKRIEIISELSRAGIPCGVMIAPVIPGLNSHEIPAIAERAAAAGALQAGFTIVRLNKDVETIFSQWMHEAFPDKADKVLHQIAACHGGQPGDQRFGTRMRGEGKLAESIRDLFRNSVRKYFAEKQMPAYDSTLFRIPVSAGDQLSLFE